jgi:hypothetical protein
MKIPPFNAVITRHFPILLAHHGLSNLTFPVLTSLEAIGVCLIIKQSLGNILLGSKNERTVLNNRLIQGRTSDDSHPSRLLCTSINLKVNNFALRLKNNVVVLLHNTLLVILANDNLPLEGVGKSVPVGRQRLSNLATGLDLNVEEPDGCVGEILD